MKSLRAKALGGFLRRSLVLVALLFVTAGTLDFWQAWLFLAVLIVPQCLIGNYFLKHNPEFLQRRLKQGARAEGRKFQKLIMWLLALFFSCMLMGAGFDRRFGWSHTPATLVIAADALILLGTLIQFQTFKTNSFASATITMHPGQQVISTGPYAVVRHPMYSGGVLTQLAIPFALGSWLVLPFALAQIAIIALRLCDEEKMLRQELTGYEDYRRNVRYRLIPWVW